MRMLSTTWCGCLCLDSMEEPVALFLIEVESFSIVQVLGLCTGIEPGCLHVDQFWNES